MKPDQPVQNAHLRFDNSTSGYYPKPDPPLPNQTPNQTTNTLETLDSIEKPYQPYLNPLLGMAEW